MDTNMIGQRIREKRINKKLTQKQLANAAHISGNISELENNKYLPSAETLLYISRVLDCSIEWILTGENRISDVKLSPRISDILSNLEQLSSEKLSEVENYITFKLFEQNNQMGKLSTSKNGSEHMDETSEIA